MPVAVHLHKVCEDFVDVIQRVRALWVARDLGDLPRSQITVNVFGKLLAFFGELINFLRNVNSRFDLYITQFFNFGFKLCNRLFEIQESSFGQSFLLCGKFRARA